MRQDSSVAYYARFVLMALWCILNDMLTLPKFSRQARGPQYVAHLESRVKALQDEADARTAPTNAKSNDERDISGWLNRHPSPTTPISPESMHSDSSRYTDSFNGHSHEFMPRNATEIPAQDIKVDPSVRSFEQKVTHPCGEMPRRRSSTAVEILNDARIVLEGLAQTNGSAKCAAQCVELIRVRRHARSGSWWRTTNICYREIFAKFLRRHSLCQISICLDRITAACQSWTPSSILLIPTN